MEARAARTERKKEARNVNESIRVEKVSAMKYAEAYKPLTDDFTVYL